MAITVALNPNQDVDSSPKTYFCLSTDEKPTIATPQGVAPPTKGSTITETDTGDTYYTTDGTNWIEVDATQAVSVVGIVELRGTMDALLVELRRTNRIGELMLGGEVPR